MCLVYCYNVYVRNTDYEKKRIKWVDTVGNEEFSYNQAKVKQNTYDYHSENKEKMNEANGHIMRETELLNLRYSGEQQEKGR